MTTIMKKTYIIPELQLTHINAATMIAESVGVNKTTTVEGDRGGWVKQDRSDHNVWGDDWSWE